MSHLHPGMWTRSRGSIGMLALDQDSKGEIWWIGSGFWFGWFGLVGLFWLVWFVIGKMTKTSLLQIWWFWFLSGRFRGTRKASHLESWVQRWAPKKAAPVLYPWTAKEDRDHVHIGSECSSIVRQDGKCVESIYKSLRVFEPVPLNGAGCSRSILRQSF